MKTKARILSAFTLCDADCEEGYHNFKRMTCQRCGAKLHVRLYQVETAEGEELIVGRECLKNVLGYKPNIFHERAEKVARRLAQYSCVFPGVILEGYGRCSALIKHADGRTWQAGLPHRMTRSLLNAGADLGYWTYPQDRIDRWSKERIPQVEWLGVD